MVACLPLVQQVRGSISGGVVNFNLKIFNLGARRGVDVHFLIARLYIAIRRTETLNLEAPLVLFEKSRLRAGTGFHLLPSFHHHSTQHNNTTQTVTLTVTLTSLSSVHYTDTHPSRNVVCPSGAWFENRPHSTPSIHLAWKPKHVIVQWVGIGTHTPCPVEMT